VPASRTELGFVPPELNVKVKAEPPLEKEPVPKGLVRVRTFEETEQVAGLRVVPLNKEQEESSTRVMELGKVITIAESVGIASSG